MVLGGDDNVLELDVPAELSVSGRVLTVLLEGGVDLPVQVACLLCAFLADLAHRLT